LAVERWFGLNFDLFESNIINPGHRIAGLVWFSAEGVWASVLERRRSAILNELEERATTSARPMPL